MKTSKFFFAGLLAALTLSLVACNDKFIEEESDLRPGSRKITITAETDNAATKAHLDGTQWWWDTDDAISILTYANVAQTASTNTKFNIVETEPATTAHFTGIISGFITGTAGDIETGYIWAMNPYQSQVSLSQGGEIKDVDMPARQYAELGSFSKNAAVAASWSPTFGVAFKNTFSLLRFTIQAESGVKAVSVRTKNGEFITGLAKLTFDGFDLSNADDKIPHAIVTEGRTGAILVADQVDPNGEFVTTPEETPAENRNWYYINVWPQSTPITDLQFILYKSDKMGVVNKHKDEGYNFERNHTVGFQNLDTFVEEWTDYKYDLELNYDAEHPMALMVGDFKKIVPTVYYGPHDITDQCTFQYTVGDSGQYAEITPQGNGKCKVLGLAVTPTFTRVAIRVTYDGGVISALTTQIPVFVYDDQFTAAVNSETGEVTRKVQFAPGNLHAWNSILNVPGDVHPLMFTARPAHTCGSANLSRPDDSQGTQYGYIDLFGWGSGHNLWLEARPDDTLYPTSMSSSNDWGSNVIFNPATPANDPAGTWRVFTQSEWNVIKDYHRMGGVSHRIPFQFVKVIIDNGNTRDCLAIYPDKYPSEKLPLPSEFRAEDLPAGICLMPLCGVRNGLEIVPGAVGYYWTGTKNSSGPVSVKLDKDAGTVSITNDYSAHYGLPVRLVKTVQ